MLAKPFIIPISACCLIIFLGSFSGYAHYYGHTPGANGTQSLGEEEKDSVLDRTIAVIQEGIVAGATNTFTPWIAPQVYLRLLGSEEGYFSANQSTFVLERFFSSFRVLRFHFTTIHRSGSKAYATGGGTFIRRGTPEIVQVYIALIKHDDAWVISQFNIY